MSKAVAVPYQEALPIEFHLDGFVVDDGAEFLREVVEHPHVVVANEEVYLYPTVSQLGQFAEDAGVSARHQIAVAEPEVEYIAQQHQGLAVVLDAVEPLAKLAFPLESIRPTAQMRVRNKINLIPQLLSIIY